MGIRAELVVGLFTRVVLRVVMFLAMLVVPVLCVSMACAQSTGVYRSLG